MAIDTSGIPAIPRTRRIAGQILSGLAVLFLLFDGVTKIVPIAFVREACAALGIPDDIVPALGITLVASTIVYTIPRTSILGAILLTGYLGGAVATHVRMGGPLFPIVFPLIVAALIWGGIYVRDDRLRALVPFCRRRPET